MEQTYLPGKIRDRIQDLMKSRKVTQAELATRIGCSKSSLSRFISGKTDKLGDENIIRIARVFNVSTDFLLGEVDTPDRLNYDISELGLSVQAARNLYTHKVNPRVVNALLENPEFANTTNLISGYLDDELAKGFAAQNLLIENNLRFIKKTAYEARSAQAELNRSLRISLDDLAQESSLGLLGCIDSYNPDSGNLFLTYAAPAIRNAMIDYIRSQNVSFEAKNLNSIISLDELTKDEVRSKHNFIADPTKQTPEQIYLAQERHDDIHRALEMIEAREKRYLRYRFGFDDEKEHPLTETAKRFICPKAERKKPKRKPWITCGWNCRGGMSSGEHFCLHPS